MSEAQPQLALERIYTKDISFEVPGAQVFTKEWQPELNINLSSSAEKLIQLTTKFHLKWLYKQTMQATRRLLSMLLKRVFSL